MRNSNRVAADSPEILELAARIHRLDPNSTCRISLDALLEIGGIFIEAKIRLERGHFISWSLAQFSYGAQWRADLMNLSRFTTDGTMARAREWGAAEGHPHSTTTAVKTSLLLLKAFNGATAPKKPARVSALYKAEAERDALVVRVKSLEERIAELESYFATMATKPRAPESSGVTRPMTELNDPGLSASVHN